MLPSDLSTRVNKSRSPERLVRLERAATHERSDLRRFHERPVRPRLRRRAVLGSGIGAPASGLHTAKTSRLDVPKSVNGVKPSLLLNVSSCQLNHEF